MRAMLRWKLRSRRGAATTEFALAATLLVPLLLYSMYFVDLAKARLKTAEIARYAVWEMTSYPLSDYAGTNHDAFFNTAATDVADDIAIRYGDDLKADTLNAAHVRYTTADWQLDRIEMTNEEARIIPNPEAYNNPGGDLIADILNTIDGTIGDILGFWGFNTKGQAHVKVKMSFAGDFMPKRYAQDFFNNELFPDNISTLHLEDEYRMIVDSWTLLDGRDVYVPGGYSKGNTDALYYQQVNRVVWLGANNFPLLGDLTNFMSKLQSVPILNSIVDLCPQCTRVASIASRGDDPNSANDIVVNVDVGEGKGGIHTTPMRDKQLSPMQSEYGKTYKKRGDWYMGCPEPQKRQCDWGGGSP
jgi:hypothetical protein